MLAAIRLMFVSPGLSVPKMSCVTLPIAPMGVVSVSPVTRQATSARKNEKTTASDALPIGHVEGVVGQDGQGDERDDLPDEEPAHGRFEFIDRAFSCDFRPARTFCRGCRTP